MSEKMYLIMCDSGDYHSSYEPVALFRSKDRAELMLAGASATYTNNLRIEEVYFSDEKLHIITEVGGLKKEQDDDK